MIEVIEAIGYHHFDLTNTFDLDLKIDECLRLGSSTLLMFYGKLCSGILSNAWRKEKGKIDQTQRKFRAPQQEELI